MDNYKEETSIIFNLDYRALEKSTIINFIYEQKLSPNQIKQYISILHKFDNSISNDIKEIKNELEIEL